MRSLGIWGISLMGVGVIVLMVVTAPFLTLGRRVSRVLIVLEIVVMVLGVSGMVAFAATTKNPAPAPLVVSQANKLGIPRNLAGAGAIIRSAADVAISPDYSYTINRIGQTSFTLKVPGEATTCITYSPTSTTWSWSSGACT